MGGREPIIFGQHMGGSTVQHHALEERPVGLDEAVLEDMQAHGLISIDYRAHDWHITPTPYGRSVIAEHDRVQDRELVADIQPLLSAVADQASASNPLAWPAVRPVLAALRMYWQGGGFSQHGIQLPALLEALPDHDARLFAATIRELVGGGYLVTVGALTSSVTAESGQTSELPTEVAITEQAHKVLDGWPGAAPEELVENLLAVLAVAAADEPDPTRKRKLERFAETVREVGVSVTSEVIAKVLTGGM
jgi:hypothetical protein